MRKLETNQFIRHFLIERAGTEIDELVSVINSLEHLPVSYTDILEGIKNTTFGEAFNRLISPDYTQWKDFHNNRDLNKDMINRANEVLIPVIQSICKSKINSSYKVVLPSDDLMDNFRINGLWKAKWPEDWYFPVSDCHKNILFFFGASHPDKEASFMVDNTNKEHQLSFQVVLYLGAVTSYSSFKDALLHELTHLLQQINRIGTDSTYKNSKALDLEHSLPHEESPNYYKQSGELEAFVSHSTFEFLNSSRGFKRIIKDNISRLRSLKNISHGDDNSLMTALVEIISKDPELLDHIKKSRTDISVQLLLKNVTNAIEVIQKVVSNWVYSNINEIYKIL